MKQGHRAEKTRLIAKVNRERAYQPLPAEARQTRRAARQGLCRERGQFRTPGSWPTRIGMVRGGFVTHWGERRKCWKKFACGRLQGENGVNVVEANSLFE